jgi:hypothetical protein
LFVRARARALAMVSSDILDCFLRTISLLAASV